MSDLTTPAPEKPSTPPKTRRRYKVPEWIGPPRYRFWFAVRNEKDELVDRVDLFGNGAFLIGGDREDSSDEEAWLVLVYENGCDAYVYDIGSRQGTFLNNTQVEREVYVKINVGDIIHFGGMSNKFIFQAPDNYRVDEDVADRRIVMLDTPERMQIQEQRTGTPVWDKHSIEVETAWIYNKLLIKPWLKRFASSLCPEHIQNFLLWRNKHKLEVPFIAMYRKDECLSLLNTDQVKEDLKWHKVLWAVQDLDVEWQALQKRKKDLKSKYLDICGKEPELTRRLILKSVIKILDDAGSDREVDDVEHKFELHFPVKGYDISVPEEQHSRFWNQLDLLSKYHICEKAGLSKIARHFSNNIKEFGVQLSLEKEGTDKVEDLESLALEFALNSGSAVFNTFANVLKGATHMAAMEIYYDPCVRKYVRCLLEHVELSTEKGDTMQILSLENSKWWLGILEAKEDALFEVNLKVTSETTINQMIDDLKKYYVGESTGEWKRNRETILRIAAKQLLIHSLREARLMMEKEGKGHACMEFGRKVWEKVVGNANDMETVRNSLAVAASFCGTGKEILSWNLCACQKYLSPGERYSVIEQIMIDITNQVGIDINAAIRNEFFFGPLQFVSGFGPKKTAAFRQALLKKKYSVVYTRDELQDLVPGPRVMFNAVGFMRVLPPGFSYPRLYILDSTRIHPESYSNAKDLVSHGYDLSSREQLDLGFDLFLYVHDMDDENKKRGSVMEERDDVTEKMKTATCMRAEPCRLNKLDVEAYAKSKKLEYKLLTMYDIRAELIQGFRDCVSSTKEHLHTEDEQVRNDDRIPQPPSIKDKANSTKQDTPSFNISSEKKK